MPGVLKSSSSSSSKLPERPDMCQGLKVVKDAGNDEGNADKFIQKHTHGMLAEPHTGCHDGFYSMQKRRTCTCSGKDKYMCHCVISGCADEIPSASSACALCMQQTALASVVGADQNAKDIG